MNGHDQILQRSLELTDAFVTETLAATIELLDAKTLDDDSHAGEPVTVGDNETIRIRLNT